MYAVFEDGSRQYRVSEGEFVRLDYRDLAPGSSIEFERVLMIQSGSGLQVGKPYIDGARIIAEVVEHPSTKLYIQHFRRRKNYRRRVGHRQPFTTVRISQILFPGQEPRSSETSESTTSEPSSAAPEGAETSDTSAAESAATS